MTGRQIRLARALKLVHLTVQTMRRRLEVGDFSMFGLQGIGKVMSAVDQGTIDPA
jgi:hypothetical protein